MGIITKMLEKRSFDSQSWIKDWLRGSEPGIDSFAGVDVGPENAVKE